MASENLTTEVGAHFFVIFFAINYGLKSVAWSVFGCFINHGLKPILSSSVHACKGAKG